MRALFLVTGLALLIGACAPTVVPPPKTGEAYYKEGEELYAARRYEDAIAEWEKVRETYQSPELMAMADFRIAEAHYQNNSFLEAAVAFEAFLKQYPTHKSVRDAHYLLGMSYYNEMLSPDRDQTATRNTLATFQSFGQRYPDDARLPEIREIVADCRDNLASHELYVANYYLRTKSYAAAIRRLTPIPVEYPEFRRLDRVYRLLGQASLRTGQREEAIAAFNTLYERFPDSREVSRAQKILAKEY